MAYISLDYSEVDFPLDEGLYELINGSYIPTEDEIPVTGKTYYISDDEEEESEPQDPEYYAYEVGALDNPSELGLYELEDGEYVITEDTVPVSGKIYYEVLDSLDDDDPLGIEDADDEYYAVEEEDIVNPTDEGLYEYDEESSTYFLTTDTFYVEGKTYYAPYETAEVEEIEDEDIPPVNSYIDDPDPLEAASNDEADVVTDLNASEFRYAYLGFVTDPHAEGLYELVNGRFVLTSDTEVDLYKLYYVHGEDTDMYVADMTDITNPALSSITFYEIVDGSYTETDDTEVISGKTYYRSRMDDMNPYLPNPSINSPLSTIDDLPEEEIVTEDEEDNDEEDGE